MNVNIDILDYGTKVFLLDTDFEESERLQKEQGKMGGIWVMKIEETSICGARIYPYAEGGPTVRYYVHGDTYDAFQFNPQDALDNGIFLTREEAEEHKKKLDELIYGTDNQD